MSEAEDAYWEWNKNRPAATGGLDFWLAAWEARGKVDAEIAKNDGRNAGHTIAAAIQALDEGEE